MNILVQDERDLCVDLESVDTSELCIHSIIDEADLCVKSMIDEDDLCTELGDSVSGIYRADTTIITADTESLTADYAL